MIVLDLGGTLLSYPAVHLNCIKDPLYHDAYISIFDGVLVRVCSWSVFEECPLCVLLLAQMFILFLFLFFITRYN